MVSSAPASRESLRRPACTLPRLEKNSADSIPADAAGRRATVNRVEKYFPILEKLEDTFSFDSPVGLPLLINKGGGANIRTELFIDNTDRAELTASYCIPQLLELRALEKTPHRFKSERHVTARLNTVLHDSVRPFRQSTSPFTLLQRKNAKIKGGDVSAPG